MKGMKSILLSAVITLFLGVPLVTYAAVQDSVVVPVVYNGVMTGAFNAFIMGDTTDSGERAHPNAVYILKKDSVYNCDFAFDINFDFTLATKGNDPGNRPPMVVRGTDPEGSRVYSFFHIVGDNVTIKFKGILFQGVRFDEEADGVGGTMMDFTGSGYRFITDGCVYNCWTSVHSSRGSMNSTFIFRNNRYRNIVGLESPFGGIIYSSKQTSQDTVIFENNTFFNVSSQYFLSITDDFIKHVEIIHNTFFSNTVNGLWAPYFTNAVIADNIWYNFQNAAQSDFEIASGYYDKSSQISSICKVYPLSETILAEWGKQEGDRRVVYKNNIYAWSQSIKDWWAANRDELHDLPLIPPVWINEKTEAAFADKETYPYLVEENNLEIDPGFAPEILEEVFTKELPFLKLFRKYGHKGYAGLAEDRYYNPGGTGKLINLPWPLPEDFTYSNETVKTHATGGYPAGDLNWYPEKKAEWEAERPPVVGIEESTIESTLPGEYKLSQNYPNPFNPSTEINFSIPVTGKTTLTIYNLLGQKVATLVDQNLTTGNYAYKFDGSHFTSGVYFYKLQSKSYTQIKKMMLIK